MKSSIQYKMKRQVETIGKFQLQIECLDNLNDTIDQVFAYLENEGNPQALEELCPYFGVIWPAARGLAEYLAALPHSELQGKKVLELGCGLALPSMIALNQGCSVLATDFHPEVPRFLESNILVNQLTHLEYRPINWEKESPDLGQFDWVIGSDILYERRYPDSLAKVIENQVRPGGKVLISDPGRPYLQGFVDAMKMRNFHCETSILKVPHPPHQQEVFILKFEKLVS